MRRRRAKPFTAPGQADCVRRLLLTSTKLAEQGAVDPRSIDVTEHKNNFPEFYITAPQPCPYLPGRLERKLFTHLTRDKPRFLIDNLLKGGFRRSQNIAYMPYCDACSACVPVRILVDAFAPGARSSASPGSNRDLVAARMQPTPSSEQYALFRDYIDARHADGGMAEMSVLDYSLMVEDSVVETFVTEYRLKPDPERRRLAADRRLALRSSQRRHLDGLQLLRSDQPQRSLGTYMILDHVEYARSLGLPFVYLGYWIEGSRKMRYKNRFSRRNGSPRRAGCGSTTAASKTGVELS